MKTTLRLPRASKHNRKNRATSLRRGILAASIAALTGLAVLSETGHAATANYTNLGGTNNWGDAGNWVALPNNNDDLVFNDATVFILSNNLNLAGTAPFLTSVNSITFGAAKGAAVTTAGGPLTMNTAGGITNNSAFLQTLSFTGTGLTLGASQAWTANTAALNVTANVALNGQTLTVAGGNNTNLAGTVSGSGALIKNGAGNLTVTNALTVDGGATLNAGTVTAAGGLTVSGGTFTGAGTLAGSLNYTSASASAFTGTISDGAAASTVTVNTGKTILGSDLDLSGSNNYTGVTNVTSGNLVVSSTNALGATGAGSGTVVFSGATLQIRGGVTTAAEALTITGIGVTSGGKNVGALFGSAFGGTSTYAGAITLSGNATIGVSAAGGGSTFNLTGGINNAGFTVTLGDQASLPAAIINVNSVITGSGGSTVDTVTTNYNASNTYTGTTTITNGGTLNATVAGALPAPPADGGTGTARSAVVMDPAGSTGGSTLALTGGFNQAVASLTGAATSTVNLNANTLTIGNSLGGAATNFAGAVNGAGGNLIKDGTSTQQLSGPNGYTGTTTINNGVLNFVNTASVASTSGITVNGSAGGPSGTLLLGNIASPATAITVGQAITLNGPGFTPTNPAVGYTTQASLAMVNGVTGNINGAVTILTNNTVITAGAGSVLNLNGGVIKNGVNVIFGNTAPGATLANSGIINIGGPGIQGTTGVGSFNSDVLYTTGTTNLIAPNPYLGATWLNNGAVVNANVAGALPSPPVDGGIAVQRTALILDADTLANFPLASYPTAPAGAIGGTGGSTINFGANQAVQFIASGPASPGTSTINLNGFALTVGTTFPATPGSVSPVTFTGVIKGTNPAFALIKDGTNTQILTGVNTYIGFTAVNGGFLQVGNGATAGSQLGTGFVFVNPGGTLDIDLANGGSFNNIVNTAVGSTVRGINGNLIATSAGAAGDVQTITQAINGGGNFIQNGGGTSIFANVNTYGGGTRITGANSNVTIGTALAGGTAGQNIAANTVLVDTGGTFQLVNVSGGILNNNIDNATAGTTGSVLSTPGAAVTTTLTGALTNTGAGATLTLTQNGPGTTILTNAGNTYAGATRVQAGTLQVGTAASVGSVGAAAITVETGGVLSLVNINGNALANNISNGVGGAGTVLVNSVNTNTLSGTLTDGAAGTLALTQSGTGTTILTNAGNTYTGATTVSGGTLQIGTAALVGSVGPTNPINVGTGGTLSIVNIGGPLGNNIQNNLGGAGTVLVASANNTTLAGNILDGAGSLAVTINNTAAAVTTTLSGANTYSGVTNVVTGTLILGTGTALGSTAGGTVVANGMTLDLFGQTVGAEALNIQGVGVGGNGALINTTAGAASLAGAITMPTTTTIGGATTIGNITLSGPIGGGAGAGIIKNGLNTLTLTGPNSYSGVTNVNAGILAVGNGTGLGQATGVAGDGTVVAALATLQIVGGGGGGINIGNEALTIGGNGAAGQAGALVNVSGTNIYAGLVTLVANSSIAALTGSTITFTGGISKNGVVLTLTGGGTINIGTIGGGQTGITGPTSFTSDLVVDGTGIGGATVANLNVPSPFAGPIWITNGGTIKANVLGALPSPAADGGIAALRTTVEFDPTAAIPGSIAPNPSTGGSTLIVNANQAVQWIDGSFGAVPASIINIAAGQTLTVGTTVLPNGTVAPPSGTTPNYAGGITGAGGLIKDGTNTQILSDTGGNSTYTGLTNVNGGILDIRSNTALGAGTGAATDGTVVATGATLQLTGGALAVGNEALTINGVGAGGIGALANAAGVNSFGGLVTLGSNSTISSNVGTLNLTNAGTITSAGGPFTLTLAGGGNGSVTSIIGPTVGSALVASLVKNGGGTWTLNGANSYVGTTTINAGTLQAGTGPTAFGNLSAVTINAGTLDLNGNSNTIGSLAGAAAVGDIVDNTAAGAATLTTGGDNTNTTFAGLIRNTGAGALSLIKTGTGAFTLTNQLSTYSGGTTLNDGALIVNPAALVATNPLGTGTLTINPTATPGLFPTGNVLGTGVNNTTLANAIVVNGDFTISSTGAVPGNFIFTGPVSLQNATRIITGVTPGSQPTFNGVISNGPGVGAGGITFTTPSPLVFIQGVPAFPAPAGGINPYVAFNMGGAVANTYTGLTTVNNNAFLVFFANAGVNKIAGNLQIDGNGVVELFGVSNQIADTSTVTVNSPGSQIIALGAATYFQGFDLNNQSETIATLNGSATGTVGLGAGILTVSSGTFAGAIVPSTVNGAVGTGGLTKTGAGTLTLTGTSSYTGTTTINAGILAAGSTKAIGNASLVVNGGVTGGTLQNATLGTTNTPLLLNIGAGNISLNGGAVKGTIAFIVGGKDGGVLLHDQITTTGKTNAIGGTLALTRTNGYLLASGDKATLVSAAAGVTGGTALGTAVPAANVTGLSQFSNTALLVPVVNLYPASIVLEALQGSFVGLNGSLLPNGQKLILTPNQLSVATALDSVAKLNNFKTGTATPGQIALKFINDQTIGGSLATVPRDLDLIAPDEITSIFHIGRALSTLQYTNLQRHFEELRAEAGSAARGTMAGLNSVNVSGMEGPRGRGGKEVAPPRRMEGNERWSTFLMGSGNFTHVGSTANASGYNLDTGGVTVGLEYKIAENFVIGVDAGYANTSAGLANGGKVDVDGGQFGLFASYFDMGFYVDAAVHGGVAGYKTRRVGLGGLATANPDGSSISALLAGGYDWKVGGWTVGPTVSFQYTNTRLDGFTETGSLAPLTIAGHNGESIRTAVGVRAFYDANVRGVIVRPELRLGWQHEYSDTAYALTSNFATLGGNAFTVFGPQVGRDSLVVGAGVTVVWNSLLSTFVAYDGELARSNTDSHSVSGGVRIKF